MYCIYYYSAFIGCCFGVLLTLSCMNDFTKFIVSHILGKEIKFTYVKTKTNGLISTDTLASSVWCTERADGGKLCNFNNLYHLPQFRGYLFFIQNEYSVISGIENYHILKQINLSTIHNHTGLYLKLLMITSSELILQQNMVFFDSDILIMKRFKPDNIMHVIHDDLLPLYTTYQELCTGNIELCISKYHLLFLDDNDEGPYFELYTYFSNYNPLFLAKQNAPICFRKSVIGLSRSSVWFQYGFKHVQGPLPNSHFNGVLLRQFSEFIKHQLGIESLDRQPGLQGPMHRPIIFLSRKLNRKILNEQVVERHIEEIYQSVYNTPVDVLNMDLSTNNTRNLISLLHKTNLLIGMHGSAMMLAIFLPPGANIIELFPYGIQPKFVSPLKALCSLPNVFYNYHVWVNENESNTKTHPEYPPLNGGLMHLPASEQKDIIRIKLVPPVECCHNPAYLFRMFQDTIVDDSFYKLLLEVFINPTNILSAEEVTKRQRKYILDSWFFPPPIFNLTCVCNDNTLELLWNFPITLFPKVKFNVATSTGIAVITESPYLYMEMEECVKKNSNLESGPSLAVWVKTVDGHKESIDSYMKCL